MRGVGPQYETKHIEFSSVYENSANIPLAESDSVPNKKTLLRMLLGFTEISLILSRRPGARDFFPNTHEYVPVARKKHPCFLRFGKKLLPQAFLSMPLPTSTKGANKKLSKLRGH